MTDKQKTLIASYRNQGYGYSQISKLMDLSLECVKSYCKRNGLGGVAAKRIEATGHVCLTCGVAVEQNAGRKEKKFCSDRCRMKWWNSHPDRINRKANYEYTCPVCKKKFSAYGNANRKYCSHECYIEDRFGGGYR